jgi:hypothetical protein
MASDDAPDSTAEEDAAGPEDSLFGIKDAIANERLDHDDKAKSMAAELIDTLKIKEKIISAIREGKNSVKIDLTTIDDKEPLYIAKQFSGEVTWKSVFAYLKSFLTKEGCSCDYVLENIGGCCTDIRSSSKDSDESLFRCRSCKKISGKHDGYGEAWCKCDDKPMYQKQELPSTYCSICYAAYKKPEIYHCYMKMKLSF